MTWRTCCDSREGYAHSDLCAAPSAQPPCTDRWDVATLKAERNRYREALEEIARDVFSDRSLTAIKCAYIARNALEPVS